jgi:hypothetical protein
MKLKAKFFLKKKPTLHPAPALPSSAARPSTAAASPVAARPSSANPSSASRKAAATASIGKTGIAAAAVMAIFAKIYQLHLLQFGVMCICAANAGNLTKL